MDHNCHVEPIQKAVLDSVLTNADKALLAVSGMGCINCAARVRNGLVSLAGVHEVEVDLSTGFVEVYYDGIKVTIEMLINGVSRAANDGRHHYEASIVSHSFRVEPA